MATAERLIRWAAWVMRYLTTLALCLALPVLAHADDYAECFRKLGDPFPSWTALFEFREQRICQSGAVYAEIWSDQVTQLLAEHWNLLPELASLAPKGSKERDFVLRSIDVTCPKDRCDRIQTLCTSECPPDLGDLCSQIRHWIAEAE